MDPEIWRLPAAVDEVLPPRAWHLEQLRRGVLDLFQSWGYEYVEPPLIEYLDALLVGNDLNLVTLKVPDQLSGRTLGVRADMTSQAARIDANSLPASGVQRLCYAGPIARATPRRVLESRVPLKAGAEIYGTTARAADLEVMLLALDALSGAGLATPVIELGDVGIVAAILDTLTLDEGRRRQVLEAIRVKSETDIASLLAGQAQADLLCELVRLMGPPEALQAARKLLGAPHPELLGVLDQLEALVEELSRQRPQAQLRVDLSEHVGFGYHKGLVFALFDIEHGTALARGGRYDGIGEQFGRARPATGFDLNLKSLLGAAPALEPTGAIWAPVAPGEEAAGRLAAMAQLRAAGERVVDALDLDAEPPPSCDRLLVLSDARWRVEPLAVRR
ncbi:MAG: ATP phosphoribosyltransferase regulatory subunit [Pseudomonadota bacterium]